KRMSGEYWNRTLPIDDVQRYEPGEDQRLYIAEAVVRQGQSNTRQLGARLINDIMRFLYDLAEQGIAFKEIYAVGTSSFGIRLCRSLGMIPLDIPEGTREDRIPFALDVATSTSPLVMAYRKKASQHLKPEVS